MSSIVSLDIIYSSVKTLEKCLLNDDENYKALKLINEEMENMDFFHRIYPHLD